VLQEHRWARGIVLDERGVLVSIAAGEKVQIVLDVDADLRP
jgi:hypothetical protein